MRLGEAVKKCKTKGYVYRTKNPNKKYYKNNLKTILERILEDFGSKGLYFKDFECFDPEQRYNVYERVVR